MYCNKCGEKLKEGQQVCLKCGFIVDSEYVEPKNTNVSSKNKSKIAAGILGILVGAFGIHNFYLGYNGKGVAQLLITILSCGTLSFVSAIWGFVEGILILTGSINFDADGNELIN